LLEPTWITEEDTTRLIDLNPQLNPFRRELRDDSKVGAGWDVMNLEDGELLFSRRCVDERRARYVANSFRQHTVRAGWVQ